MNISISPKIRGEYKIVCAATGEVLLDWTKNLILDQGLGLISMSPYVDTIAVGDGTAPVLPGQTTLENETYKGNVFNWTAVPGIAPDYLASTIYTTQLTGALRPTDVSITEAGFGYTLFSGGPISLFSRAVFSPIVLLADTTYTLQYKVTITPHVADIVTNLGTLRPANVASDAWCPFYNTFGTASRVGMEAEIIGYSGAIQSITAETPLGDAIPLRYFRVDPTFTTPRTYAKFAAFDDGEYAGDIGALLIVTKLGTYQLGLAFPIDKALEEIFGALLTVSWSRG